MTKLLSIPLAAFLFGAAALLFPVLAGEFQVVIDRQYTVEADGSMQVVESHTVTNNSENLLISKSNEETFQIPVIGNDENLLRQSVATATISVGGNSLPFSTVYKDRFAELKVAYPSELRRGQTVTFRLSYSNFGLVEKSGALFDVYAPGFVSDFKFSQGLTDVSYKTTFNISNQLPAENFIIPNPAQNLPGDNYRSISFSQESLLGTTVWIQLGKTQYYSFSIAQEAPATDSRNSGYMNEYRIILPRNIDEIEIAQNVFFTKISPEPFQVLEDEEGNLVGYFKVPSHETTTITIEGYAEVKTKDTELSAELSGSLAEVPQEYLASYTQAAQFWEVDAPEINQLASELAGSETNIFKIVEATYRHIVDTIDYSEVKRFGINERQGALKTLNGGAAVCMEYSDLFLTLSRAQGIPARAAFGYGYDSRLPANQQEAHQWVEVYMPGTGKWVSVDVTWGESGPALIGGDLNHFYTHTAGQDPNTPAMVERVSYGENLELDAPVFNFAASENIPQGIFTTSPAELLEKYPKVETFDLQASVNQFFTSIKTAFTSGGSGTGQLLVFGGVFVSLAAIITLFYVLIGGRKKPQMPQAY